MGDFFLLFLGVAVAVLIFWGMTVMERERRNALETVAAGLGLSFDPESDRSLHRSFGHSIFGKGHSQKAANTLWGVLTLAGYPIDVRMGDFRYVTGHGKQRQTHNLSYALFKLPFVGTPELLIRKENLGDKLVGGIGFDDIDFESAEFSRRFLVKSPDRRWAYDVLHQKTMELMLARPNFTLDFQGSQVMAYRDNKTLSTGEFSAALQLITGILDNLPESVVRELKGVDAEARLP